MPTVNFQTFRNIAAEAARGDNAEIYIKSGSDGQGELRTGLCNTGPLRRAVIWMGCKLGHSGSIRRQAEIRGAYNGFLDALGRDNDYRGQVNLARGRLSADMTANKPLTARKVSQVLSELEARNPEHVAQNRGAAEAASNAGANVYDPKSMVLDPGRISAAEVHGIMPHLLSDREKPAGISSRTPDAQKGDILHAKLDFLEAEHNMEARGQGLTDREIRHIDDYIESSRINKPLGEKLGDGSLLPGHLRPQHDGIQRALAKLPDERGVVYRGMTTSHNTINEFRKGVGALFTSTAFLSTSASPNYAKLYSEEDGPRNQAEQDCEVRFQILGRTGKNISGIRDIKETREFPGVDVDPAGNLGAGEILFRPGTDFRLVAFAKHPHKEVYGMVLREEPRTGQPPETLFNLNDADRMGEKGQVRNSEVDGLASELVRLYDEKSVQSG